MAYGFFRSAPEGMGRLRSWTIPTRDRAADAGIQTVHELNEAMPAVVMPSMRACGARQRSGALSRPEHIEDGLLHALCARLTHERALAIQYRLMSRALSGNDRLACGH